jgi:hypothetical protein
LGFLGGPPVRCEDPRLWGLDFLGFPWILSSESSDFNGLRGFFGVNFSRPVPLRQKARGRERPAEPTGKRGIVHQGQHKPVSGFLQRIVVPTVLSAA